MAKRVVHQLIDDIDGTVLADGEGRSVRFSLDGTMWEIDLASKNVDALRAALQPYIDAGRRVTAGGSSVSSSRKRSSATVDAARIRAWAAENGHTVSERGRVPASVIEAFNAAHA